MVKLDKIQQASKKPVVKTKPSNQVKTVAKDGSNPIVQQTTKKQVAKNTRFTNRRKALSELDTASVINRAPKKEIVKQVKPTNNTAVKVKHTTAEVSKVKRTSKINQKNVIHGNSKNSSKPSTIYAKFDKEGKFKKWGISQNPAKRYSKKQLADGEIVTYKRGTGSRSSILKRERKLTERFPGPENNEPWAGIKK